MRLADIAVAVVWIVFVAGALSSGIAMGYVEPAFPPGTPQLFPPVNVAIFLLVFFFVASSAGVFLLRRVLLRGDWSARLIDSIWGQGAYAGIIVRLRPLLLMIVVCLIMGSIGLASTHAQSQSWNAYFNSVFALTLGAGLLSAYALSRKFPPKLH